ncbi:uncharacterized protein LOC128165706 isoform X1 [Crassostrea angulata]|uniref:uncharacterized protein LOC128165706 isoform X1 n=1 Tax=Magallana angulata TaxID=2784310 RepID=UPI0022B16FED|nr:uncharacterized protein LOC128165706 isoform X1 [Crassostrea angulata]
MHQTAKKEFSSNKLSQRKTGGGTCAKPLSVVSEKIVDLYKDSPTFNGLSGFETQSTDESNIEVIGSPTTVSILTELLIPSVQESGDQVPEECCEQAQNDESYHYRSNRKTYFKYSHNCDDLYGVKHVIIIIFDIILCLHLHDFVYTLFKNKHLYAL